MIDKPLAADSDRPAGEAGTPSPGRTSEREQLRKHIAAIDGRRPEDGHSDRGFATCPHPDCAAFREAGAPSPKCPAFWAQMDIPTHRCTLSMGHRGDHVDARDGIRWNTNTEAVAPSPYFVKCQGCGITIRWMSLYGDWCAVCKPRS